MEQELLLLKKDSIAYLTINRPSSYNAFSTDLAERMIEQLAFLQADKEIRCLVITGAGDKAFVAGADIRQFTTLSPAGAKHMIETGHKVFNFIENLPIPTIASINGHCLGGGLELAMSCDLRLCVKSAKIGLPEINLGVAPAWGGTLRLPRLIGEGRAKEMILTGRPISGGKALEYGLVSGAYDTLEELREETDKLAALLASKPPIAMELDKKLIHDARTGDPLHTVHHDALAMSHLFTTEDCREGINAFLEKRPPHFIGK